MGYGVNESNGQSLYNIDMLVKQLLKMTKG